MSTDPEQIKNIGNEKYKQGAYKEAVNYYTQAIELSPDTPAYYSNRAAAYVMLKEYSAALKDCKKVLSLEPNNVKVHLRAGKCYVEIGHFQKAINHLKKVLEFEPNNLQAKNELISLESIKDKVDQIKKSIESERYSNALTMLSQLALDSSQVRLLQAESLIGIRQYSQATRIIADVLREEPSNIDGLVLRSKCFYYLGNLESAESLLRKVLNMDPDCPKAQVLFRKIKKINKLKEDGNEYFKLSQFKEAIDSYQQAIEEDNKLGSLHSTLYSNIAAALMSLEQYEEAEKYCTKALSLDSNYDKALLRRARCRMKLEKYEDAIKDYEEAYKKEPSNELKSRIREAQLELKKSKRKDYYKILGISKTATAPEISKAYKKMALMHHPDRKTGEEEKKVAEAKFKDINEAYSVLSDANKKARYDAGADIEELGNEGFHNVNVHDFFRQHTGFPGGGFSGGSGFPGGSGFEFFFN